MDSLPEPRAHSAAAIEAWILAWLARELELELPPGEMDPGQTFEFFGASSLEIVTMTGDLEEWLGRPVDSAIVYDHPTVASFAAYLAGEAAVAA